MGTKPAPIACPECGCAMNRHAEKPSEPGSDQEAQALVLGAVVIEVIHTCPRCGAISSRRTTGP